VTFPYSSFPIQITIFLTFSVMDSNDLFSFLDEAPADTGEGNDSDHDAIQTDPKNSSNSLPRKRKLSPFPREGPSPRNGDVPMRELEDEPGPSALKKPRMASPKPIVLDDFETEAKREVAASAGLTGGVEAGSRLELRHQVRNASFLFPHFVTSYVGPSPSGRPARLQLHSNLKSRPPVKT